MKLFPAFHCIFFAHAFFKPFQKKDVVAKRGTSFDDSIKKIKYRSQSGLGYLSGYHFFIAKSILSLSSRRDPSIVLENCMERFASRSLRDDKLDENNLKKK
ncbi:hypothetical protein AMQ68_21450 [Chryseobacterium sp. ERMR1:04]|nr:hypothetical protein AMQ68_21450 [Chryseobacterium sp. ERMR1:04]